ncbi:MAG TPA: thymidylate synthase [Phycisphaerae bacterium]|nr:thymidylate synthase [Phycisphaerae bacterium]
MKQYLDLIRTVMEHGVRKPSRTGIQTISYFGAFYKVDLAEGFPLLTTKKVNYPAVLRELLWYLSGEEHIRNLRQYTKIWDAWADQTGELQTAYGRYWRRFPHPVQATHAPLSQTGEKTAPIEEIDQIGYVINEIKRNPESRRLVVSAWEPGNAERSKLPPCHYSFVFQVLDGKLNCHLSQRSGDVALGIPFNLACYATLTQMIAQECNLELGQFAHTIVDAHIYVANAGSPQAEFDHLEGLKLQLERQPRPLPRLTIARKPFDQLGFEDFRVEGYDPHPSISFKVAV